MKIIKTHRIHLRNLLQPIVNRTPVHIYRAIHPSFTLQKIRRDYLQAAPESKEFLENEIYRYASDKQLDSALAHIFRTEHWNNEN